MKKKFIFFLFFLSINLFGQMDTEHWFAPMGRAANSSFTNQYLYLSTDQMTPFEVKIYNNNLLVTQAVISKGSPGIISINDDLMMTDNSALKFSVTGMGLHLVADSKFFAHFRFSVPNHAEIVTSKGKAGLGKEFFAYTPQNNGTANHANSTVGIVATEDLTTVEVDNFRDLSLENGEVVNPLTVKTITLNRGQSYILESKAVDNPFGLSGIRIKASKDIAVTSGSFTNISPNGQNVDIYMDQASPIDRLGQDYIAVKGNGELNIGMETVAIMATEDNTAVYLNGNSVPSATLLKKGDVFLAPDDSYTLASAAVDSYNMYIRSDKKVYAYQHLAGVTDPLGNNSYASGGMNILPQLTCLLPSTIDEFALVNEIGSATFDTRLNVITQSGSDIAINGAAATAANGPFAVPGNLDWVTYTFIGITGNVKIESTNGKAVTAGIAAGDGAVGYGGYFAGFNSIPVVSKGGNCITGTITLEVDSTYDSYQWYRNGVPYLGPDANTFKITSPPPGIYFVEIEKFSCPGKKRSPDYKVLSCPQLSTLPTFTIGNCESIKIQPVFTSSSQTLNLSSVTVTSPPANGTATVNPTTGEITYVVTSPTALSDTFIFYVEGTGAFPDSEYITVNINIQRINFGNAEITECNTNGSGIYDLTSALLTSDTNIESIHYFESRMDAQSPTSTNYIINETQYQSSPKIVYARIINSYGCLEIAEIALKAFAVPQITSIIVQGNGITINASGGNGGYQYTWDGLCTGECDDITEFTPNNRFENIPRGLHTAYVIDSEGCEIVSKQFLIINLINIISPNGDNRNEVLNYSDLSIKKDVKIEIFDRFGKQVFISQKPPYIWDGKMNGRVLPTGTYWYTLTWVEPDTNAAASYKGWILLKNRN